jgi:dTDP-glucose pyrophosphorylase
MKGVILAGGSGSRLAPLTRIKNLDFVPSVRGRAR